MPSVSTGTSPTSMPMPVDWVKAVLALRCSLRSRMPSKRQTWPLVLSSRWKLLRMDLVLVVSLMLRPATGMDQGQQGVGDKSNEEALKAQYLEGHRRH